MNRETQINLVKELDQEMIKVLISKSKDYATEDVLSNFKRLSGAAKTLNVDVRTPQGFALFMVLMKLDRINNLLTSGKTPSNESLADSFVDLLNYGKLTYCIVKENESPNKAWESKIDTRGSITVTSSPVPKDASISQMGHKVETKFPPVESYTYRDHEDVEKTFVPHQLGMDDFFGPAPIVERILTPLEGLFEEPKVAPFMGGPATTHEFKLT